MTDTGFSPKEAKADAKAAAARAKSMRPWWKKKRFILPLALLALIVIISISGGGADDADTGKKAGDNASSPTTDKTETKTDTKKVLFPGRPDSQKEDQERNIGESARLSGYTGTVTAASFKQSVSDYEKDGYISIDVTIENRDDKAQPYNTYDWKLQTPNGQVIDPTITTGQTLGSGDLVQGGKVSGQVVFEVGATKGDFYIIYKPDAFDAARGIWKVTA